MTFNTRGTTDDMRPSNRAQPGHSCTGVWFARSSLQPLTLVLKATGIPKRAGTGCASNVHRISSREFLRACVELSKRPNDCQELNDSGATDALRSETASICSRQTGRRYLK